MIVSQTQEGWRIIYHRAHALLASQLGGHWKRSESPPRIYESLAAIGHHDDLEREWEGNHLTKAGAPMDFTLDSIDEDNLEKSLNRMRTHVKNSLYRGRWVALLTSMHMSRLNEPQRGTSKEMDAFLDEQLGNQKGWIEDLGITKDEAATSYAFMQWCDRLSLILCQDEIPDDQRALEISEGPDGDRYDLIEQSDGCITVVPWPFQDDRFTVNVDSLLLEQLQFKDNDELTQAMQEAPVESLEWTFVKTS